MYVMQLLRKRIQCINYLERSCAKLQA